MQRRLDGTPGSKKSRLQATLRLAVLAALGTACTATISDPKAERRTEPRVGEVGLDLSLSPGQAIDGATYTISRDGGFSQRGTIPRGASRGFAALLALPEAQDYTIDLVAMSKGVRCAGSERFDVWAHRRISVSVVMRCAGASSNTGSVEFDGRLNLCPVAHAIVATPRQGTLGDSVRLYGTASDSDGLPSPLTYTWSSTSGALGDQRLDSIGFSCTEVGIAAVTLVVSDGDSGCGRTSASLTIVCVDGPADGGVAGAASIDASIPVPNEPDDEDAGGTDSVQ